MEPMTKFSMLQAAKEIGVAQSTMHRYLKSGRVSYSKTEAGYEIDASELHRAFPPGWNKKGSGTVSVTPSREDAEPHGTPTETSNESGALRAEIKMLREMLERADLDNDRQRREAADTIADYRARLDREAEERRALNARLLTYQQPPEAVVPPPSPPSAPLSPMPPPIKRGIMGLFRRTG